MVRKLRSVPAGQKAEGPRVKVSNEELGSTERRAVLVGPRADPPPIDIYQEQDWIVAVDGGLDVCRDLGLVPDFAVGDWDSVRAKDVLKNIPHQTLAAEKDRSDLYHAIQYALSQSVSEVVCVGVTGGRTDHQIGMLLELAEAAAKNPSVRFQAVGPEGEYYWLTPKIAHENKAFELQLEAGELFSVFATGWGAHGVSLSGGEYELQDSELFPGTRGLSNRAGRHGVKIWLKAGVILTVVPR